MPNVVWNIPHGKSFVCDRQCLFRHAEQADLDLEPDQLLPDAVLLLLRPDAEEMSNLERKPLLLKYWRRLFHARVHQALLVLERAGGLDDAAVRERVEAIGRTEFAEITDVLTQDRYLPPDATEREVYLEFAAVYLELRKFAGNLLAGYFPGLHDLPRIDALLRRDVDADTVLRQTRPAEAPDPVGQVDTTSDESQEAYWTMVRHAQKASLAGDTVKAAVLRLRASRIAPAALTESTLREAQEDIATLSRRLAKALAMGDAERDDWARHLVRLLDKADQGTLPTEARLLHDLQDVCEDHEHEIFTLDLVEFALSGGKRPIKRPLPSQRLVRIVKHLRQAEGRLGEARLSDVDRGHLGRLIRLELTRAEEALRRRFRPVLVTAMDDVGLKPTNPVEQAAFDKMVDELLDRISAYGYLTATELRDTISRNQLKLPDLVDPDHFLRGDPFVRLDRRLGMLLDGVYRPSDFYVRWLERGGALLFGTSWGRPLTLYLILPLFLAWLTMHVLGMMSLKTAQLTVGYEEAPLLTAVGQVLQGPTHDDESLPGLEHHLLWHLAVLGGLTVFTGGLMHSAGLRRRCARLVRGVWRSVYWVFIQVPLQFVPLATLRRLLNGWVFQLLYWYLVKPLLVGLLLVLLVPYLRHNWTAVVLTFLAAGVVVNSRSGRAVSEGLRDAILRLGTLVRAGLLPGLVHLIMQVFKQTLEWLEYCLIVVEEWLRYRSGDSTMSLVLRTLAGVVWFPVAFLARFYTVVLIEPTINPLKFPIASVAYKVLFPVLYMTPRANLTGHAAPFMTQALAVPFVELTVFLLPDSVAFLVWEMKENWSLYRANRGANVRPVSVGGYGETAGCCTRGSTPAPCRGCTGGCGRRSARAADEELGAGHSTGRSWKGWRPPCTASSPARSSPCCASAATRHGRESTLSGAAVQQPRRLGADPPPAPGPAGADRRRVHPRAGCRRAASRRLARHPGHRRSAGVRRLRLAYLYRMAGVDLVCEQLQAEVGGPVRHRFHHQRATGVAGEHLDPVRYPLSDWLDPPDADSPVRRLFFSRHALPWAEWVAFWQLEQIDDPVPSPPWLQNVLTGVYTATETPPAPAGSNGHPVPSSPVRLETTNGEKEGREPRPAAESQADGAGANASRCEHPSTWPMRATATRRMSMCPTCWRPRPASTAPTSPAARRR
ncbi:MAG: hypothetical protein U0736_02060 [Gemmataceae bacterium]